MTRKSEERFEVVLSEEVTKELLSLPLKHRTKILYNIRKSIFLNDAVLFKKLDELLWEFRTLYGGIHYRLLAVWGKENGNSKVFVLTLFIKKTNKTPLKELEKAKAIWLKRLNPKQ